MTLKELARLLGLSQTTVSRALNGYPEVRAETRARVLEAATRHGYAPNQVARRLATGRSMAIAHVIPLAEHQMINPIFADFIAGCGETYAAAGYDMLMSMVAEGEEADAYAQLAAQHKVDGVIVHSPKVEDPRPALLKRLGLPFVLHGRDGDDRPDFPFLDIDNRRAFRRATDHLLAHGHRRIALVNGLETLSFAWRRRLGYEEALRAAGIRPDQSMMRSGEMREPYGHHTAHEMLARPAPPTAFLCASVLIAHGVLRAVRDARLEPGRDVSIVAHDDALSAFSSASAPIFTATHSSIRAAGRRCAEMLVALIEAPGRPPPSELWQADLVIGPTSGPVLSERQHA